LRIEADAGDAGAIARTRARSDGEIIAIDRDGLRRLVQTVGEGSSCIQFVHRALQ